ncbi:centrosomal protein of 135 kDa-like [Styela clava]
MNKVTEQKFVTLRKQLDQLGYRHAFGIDSMPLVNQLFSDLLHTTDSLKKAKVNLHKAAAPTANPNIDDILEPYSKDNARLVQENNSLHLQCVRLKEEIDATSKELKSKIIKLDHENSDLRFLNNQFVHKVRVLESETASKTESIQKLQEKNLQAVIQTPGGRKRNIPFRRQHMQVDGTLPPSFSASYISTQPDDPYIADLLQVADTKIDQLAVELKLLSESNYVCESKISTLRGQVEMRDREIERLNRCLEGGRPHDVLSLEAKNSANERLISHLNLQVEYLQQTNEELEIRLKEDEAQHEECQMSERRYADEVERLKLEIKEIDHLANQLENDKRKAVSAADLEIHEAQQELRRSQRQENDLESQLVNAEESREKLITENEDLHLRLQSQEQEIDGLNELLNKVKTDKDLLSKQVKNLMDKERELVMELEDQQLSGIGVHRKDRGESRLDAFIKTLEHERDYYKNECDLLNSMLQKREKQKDSDILRSTSRSPKNKIMDKSASEQFKQYEKVIRERDELQAMLDKFERHMSEIQANVKILTQERDKTNLLYEQTHDELQRLRREAVRSPRSAKASLTAQAILRRVETERDNAVSDLRRMTTERDSLREHINIQKNQSSTNITRLEQRLSDLADKIEALEGERIELKSRLQSTMESNIAQEEDLKALRAKLHELEAERQDAQERFEDSQTCRMQLDASLENTKQKLSKKMKEHEVLEDRVRVLENRIAELLDTSTRQTDDATGLRTTVTILDREKDGLQATLDEKTEKIALLEDQIAKRESQIMDQRVTISNIEKQLDRATEDISSSDRELRSLRRQLDTTQTELAEALRGRDVAVRENSRLQDDLATLTRENQDLNIELDNVLREREEGRVKIKEFISRVANSEGNIASKDREMLDLLEQYRKVSVERDTTESKYRLLADETQALKLELMTAENEKVRLGDKNRCLEQEVLEHLHSQQIYENNIAELTSNIQRLENEIHRSNEERSLIAVDLSSARDLNAKLDIGKEQFVRQLASKNVEYEQLKVRHDELTREVEILQEQIESDRMERKNLESLIASSREKEYRSQTSMQELNGSYQNLKDQLSLAEGKLTHQGREVNTLRAKVSQLDADLEITKRQLTNERYERERAVQELRKHNLPSPITSRSDRPSPSQRPRSASPARASFLDTK